MSIINNLVEIRALVEYTPETGAFWSLKFHRPIGNLNALGYVQMMIGGQFFYGHRLAWLLTYGTMPKYIDHANRDRSDNRLCNLREATHSQNMGNMARRADNSCGLKGIYQIPSTGRWRARIKAQGKKIELGVHDTKEAAHAAYREGASRYFGEFARFN